jgi:adenylate cyclase class 2
MREIEVKILGIDKNKLVARLKRLGARKTFDGAIKASFFDYKDDRLKKTGRLLRLREGAAGTILAFKAPAGRSRVKTMKEFEFSLSDPRALRAVLSGLGLKESGRTHKHRTSFRLGKAHFELDTYPGIPTYLEIEAPSERAVRKHVQLLGFNMKQARPWTWRDVFRHYGRKAG